jgi:hypothetical protein
MWVLLQRRMISAINEHAFSAVRPSTYVLLRTDAIARVKLQLKYLYSSPVTLCSVCGREFQLCYEIE